MANYLKGIGDAVTRVNEILPSFDARINNFLIGHASGIIRGEFNEFNANTIDRGVRIRSGMMQAHGFFGACDTDTQINFVMPSATRYVQIFAEIDLSVIPNRFEVKATAQSNSTAHTFRLDNLRTIPNGRFQLHLWQVTLTATAVTLQDRRAFIDKVRDAVNAEQATNATNAGHATTAGSATSATTATNATRVNDLNFGRNTSFNSLTVQFPSASTTEFIERKRTLYTNNSGFHIMATVSRGTTFTLNESVADGELIEFEYKLETFGTTRRTFRARLDGGTSITIIDFRAGLTRNSGFTAYSWTFSFSGSTMTYTGGYYLLNWANNGGSLLENCEMRLYKVSKVLGSNV